jgi:hypothetical protein
MPDVSQISADLTTLMRRSALIDYENACDNAQHAAARCIDDGPERDLGEFARCRAEIARGEAALELIGADITTDAPLKVVLDDRARDLIAALIERTIYLTIDALDMAPDEEQVLAAADSARRLRDLLADLELTAVAA